MRNSKWPLSVKLEERNHEIRAAIFFSNLPFSSLFLVDSHPGCGASGATLKWMDSVARSAILEDDVDDDSLSDETASASAESLPLASDDEDPEYKYTAEANNPGRRRHKRALENPNKKKSCSLYIQTDPLFWRHIRETVRRPPKI